MLNLNSRHLLKQCMQLYIPIYLANHKELFSLHSSRFKLSMYDLSNISNVLMDDAVTVENINALAVVSR